MKIGNNAVVSIHFRLTNAQNEELDNSAGGEPLVYLHGAGELIDGLETALAGRLAGESLVVVITPEDAYGDVDPALIRTLHKDEFNGAEMREGMKLQGKDPEGNFQLLRVVKVDGDNVTIDTNHPLAGETLTFEVSIQSVRPATDEEVEAGQVL